MKKLFDLNGLPIEIKISHDGKTVWINTSEGCALRANKISELFIDDMRRK